MKCEAEQTDIYIISSFIVGITSLQVGKKSCQCFVF